jgi:protease-4
MRKSVVWLFAVLLVGAYLITANNIRIKKSKTGHKLPVVSVTGAKIALINITGEISDTTPILRQLQEFDSMQNVKAIVLRINSGGGAVAASQEVYSLVRKISDSGKPVIVSMGDVAASGAYYISAAADKIVANPGTLTGSIGVIMFFFTARELMQKIGVDYVTIKTGKYKDIGSFSRNATPEEKAMLLSVMNDVLNQFVDDIVKVRYEAIAKGAGIKAKDVEVKQKLCRAYMLANIADGRVFSGNQALKLGLVDQVGSIDDAILLAAKTVGIEGRPNVVTEKEKLSFYQWMSSALNNLNLKGSLRLSDNYMMR